MADNAYLPMTINEIIERLQKIIRDPTNPLTGEETVEDAYYISSESDPEYPPNTILFSVREITKNPMDDNLGTLSMSPRKLNKRMN